MEAWVIVGLALSVASPASAQTLDEALEHFYGARFDDAAEALDAVLASDALDLPAAVEAHRYRAALYLLAGDDVEARRHARAAVALDPQIAPPEGVSRAASVFDAARASLPDAPARLAIRAREVDGAREVEASVAPHVPTLVGEVSLRCGEDEAREPGASARLTVLDAASCDARAYSPGGAALLREALTLDALDESDGLDETTLIGLLAGAGGAVVLTVIIVAVAVALDPPGVSFDALEVPWQ